MNAQERLAELLEVVETPNTKGWMAGELPEALGSLADANTLLGIIEQASPLTRTAFIALSLPTGLQLWDKGPLLDALPLPADLRDRVKALGITSRARWQIEDYENQPTLEQITNELQRESWKTRFDAILNQIGTTEQADGVTALRTIADEMEAA